MATATVGQSNAPAGPPTGAKLRALPPHEQMAQKAFMTQFGPALTEHVARACPPHYTGPQDTPWAPLGLLDHRKPLGAQGFVAQAAANAIRGLRPYQGRLGRRRRRGVMYIAQVGTGKTYMGLVTARLADEQVTGIRASADQRPEKASFFPLIVLCPPIMVRKWAREASITVPGAKVAIIEAISTREQEADLRRFDPTYKGGRLSAIGCAERVARRIQAELAAWRKACAAARQQHQPLPKKPAHIVVLSQNTAKLGSAWRPVYQMKYLMETVPGREPGSARSVRFVRDGVTGEPIQVPCCPSCGLPLQRDAGPRRARRKGPDMAEEDQAQEYLSEQDLLGTAGKRVKRWCENLVTRQARHADGTWRKVQVRCGAALWEVIPSTQAPELHPLGNPGEREARPALPLPGATRRARRVDERCFEAAGWEWFQPQGDEAHPLCIKSTANRRLPVADYILRHWKGLFETVVVDEAHQYSGAGTAQGFAAASLVDATNTAIGLTGTLFGGYSSTLFPMLWRLIPELRQVFGYKDLQRWIDLYGVRQKTFKRKEGSRREDGVTSKRRDEGSDNKELPGISPLVLGHILPCCFFLEIPDVVKDLPPYKEEVVTVPMGPELEPEYQRFERQVTNALRQLLVLGDHAALASWFQGLMVQPSAPWLNVRVVHPRTHQVLGASLPLPEDHIYPKEAALLQHIREERAQGRRVLVYVEHTGEYDLLPRVKRLIEEDDARWRGEIWAERPRPAQFAPVRVKLLRSETVQTKDREAWLTKAIEDGCDVLVCNAALVEVGLDLIAFATILVYEVIFNTNRWRQAIGRCHRPGQKLPVRVVQFAYTKAMEARGLVLIAQKVAASMMAEGKLPGGESFTTQTLGKGAGNPILELAQSVIADEDGQRAIEGSLEQAFAEMLAVEQHQDELIGGEAIAAALREPSSAEPVLAEADVIPLLAEAASAVEEKSATDVAEEEEAVKADVLLETATQPVALSDQADAAAPLEELNQSALWQAPTPASRNKKRRKHRHGAKHRVSGTQSAKAAHPAAGGQDKQPETSAPRQIMPVTLSSQRPTFGRPPGHQHPQKPATLSPGSLWGEWAVFEVKPPQKNGLMAEVSGNAHAALSLTPMPTGGPSPVEPDGLAELVREEAVEAAATNLPSDDERCVECGAPVEFYTGEGVPYCQNHRPSQAQEATLQKLAEPTERACAEEEEELIEATAALRPEPLSVPVVVRKPLEQIVEALRYLAGVCDGASRRDGHGFNKVDTDFGHSLARRSLQQALTPKQLRKAAEMLGAYQRQLREAGLALPTRQEVERALAEDGQRQEASGSGTFRLDGEHVIVSFRWGEPEKVAAIKAIRAEYGGVGFVAGKPPSWVLPIDALVAVLEQFPDLESVA